VSVSRRRPHEPDTAVTTAELRSPDLPYQYFGGYSRGATDDLLSRAAATLERLTEDPLPDEQTVGEALVTAHRAADSVRAEARDEAAALIAAAQTHADEIIKAAERRADELRAEQAAVESDLSRAREEAQAAERVIAEMHGEARRVRLVIDDFRSQWSNVVGGALKQLEVRISGRDQPADDASVEPVLRERLAEPLAEPQAHDFGDGARSSVPSGGEARES
jgi:hypothetical protein